MDEGRLKDSFFLGGELYLLSSLPSEFPDGVIQAYQAAFPVESALTPLQEKIQELGEDQLGGFISAIKGKLFEMEYANYLNAGNLPDGFTATLAESSTQPGWDILISGPDAGTVELLQAKASDSIGYVREALVQYPDIDVVTTSEVYSQLTMRGISEGLVNSGISHTSLLETVTGAVSLEDIAMDFSPPVVTLALIAFTSYRGKNLDAYQKARQAGGRSGKAYMAYLLGNAAAAITNTWWLGLACSVGSRFLVEPGQRKWELYWELRKFKEQNQALIDRFRGLSPQGS